MYYTVIFYMHDTSAMQWYDTATDEDDALAQATTYFEDGGNGPIVGMTRTMRAPTPPGIPLGEEELPPEGVYVYEVRVDAERAAA